MTTQQLYQKTLNEQVSHSEFLSAVRKDPQYSNILTNVMSFEDTIRTLKSKGFIWDANKETTQVKSLDFLGLFKALNEAATKKQKLKGGKGDKLTPDQVNYFEFRKGWQCELEHTDDIDKAKEIALDHLAEDPMYYTRLEMIETKSKKKERSDLPIDISVKKASLKDDKNQMSSVNKKKEKPNVSDSGKKEKARSKSAGIKKMKGGSGEMKSLKEEAENPDKPETGPTSKPGTDSSDKKGNFYVEFTKPSADLGKEATYDLTYERYKRMYVGNMSSKKYVNIIPIDDTAKQFKNQLKDELKKEKEKKTGKETGKETFQSKLKSDIEKIRAGRSEKSADPYNVVFVGRDKKTIVYMSPKEADKRIKNPDKYNISSIKKSDSENIQIDASTKFDIKSITGGTKITTVTLAPIEAEKRIADPEKYNIEYMIKVGTLSTLPIKPAYKYDEYPAYVYDNVDDVLIGQERLFFAREYEENNPSRYTAMSKAEAKAKKEMSISLGKEIMYKDEPKSKNKENSNIQNLQDLKNQQISFSQGTNKISNTVSNISYVPKSNMAILKMNDGAVLHIYDVGTPEAKVYYFSKGAEIKKSDEYEASQFVSPAADIIYGTKKVKESILEEYIRAKVRKLLKEYDAGLYIGVSGPDVVKKKLEDYLKRYDANWETDPSPKQRSINMEYEDIISQLVDELNNKESGEGDKMVKKYTSKPTAKNAADRRTPPPTTLAYDPTKLVSRGGRIAEGNKTNPIIKKYDAIFRNPETNIEDFKNKYQEIKSINRAASKQTPENHDKLHAFVLNGPSLVKSGHITKDELSQIRGIYFEMKRNIGIN